MEITNRTSGDCPVLDLNGRLYLGPATNKLRGAVRELSKKNQGKIVVNMRNVKGLDTAGLGELVDSRSHAKSLGQDLVLLNPQERSMRLLLLTKMETVFDIYHDEALAVANSGQRAARL
jgi:anti-sigma B factor antagonist